MVSKMMKAVAVGLVPGSQGQVLAVPLPRMASAVALALGLLQVCGCNPRCWRGWLCRGVTPLTALPVLSSGWYDTRVWKPLEDLPPPLYYSLGLYLPSHRQESLSSQCRLQLHPPSGTGWSQA